MSHAHDSEKIVLMLAERAYTSVAPTDRGDRESVARACTALALAYATACAGTGQSREDATRGVLVVWPLARMNVAKHVNDPDEKLKFAPFDDERFKMLLHAGFRRDAVQAMHCLVDVLIEDVTEEGFDVLIAAMKKRAGA